MVVLIDMENGLIISYPAVNWLSCSLILLAVSASCEIVVKPSNVSLSLKEIIIPMAKKKIARIKFAMRAYCAQSIINATCFLHMAINSRLSLKDDRKALKP